MPGVRYPTLASTVETHLNRPTVKKLAGTGKQRAIQDVPNNGYTYFTSHPDAPRAEYIAGEGWRLACACGRKVGLLSQPEKVGRSWSLPAVDACPAAMFGEGAICGTSRADTSCYATKGSYAWSSTVHAVWVRFHWTLAMLESIEGREEWVRVMVDCIGRLRAPRFRVHDSGDIFSPEYARMWAAVVRALPAKRFWTPTRTVRLGARDLDLQAALLENSDAGQHALRPSALLRDMPPPSYPGMSAGTTVLTAPMAGVWTCPASLNNGHCGESAALGGDSCYVCYGECPSKSMARRISKATGIPARAIMADPRIVPVGYPIHAIAGTEAAHRRLFA